MVLKKDKKKVLGEFFDDDRIRGFLVAQAPEGVNLDFHILERAYRGMQAENFTTFVQFFIEAGHDINSKNTSNKTLLDLVKDHEAFTEYADILRQSGAS